LLLVVLLLLLVVLILVVVVLLLGDFMMRRLLLLLLLMLNLFMLSISGGDGIRLPVKLLLVFCHPKGRWKLGVLFHGHQQGHRF